jgi:urease accessory protein
MTEQNSPQHHIHLQQAPTELAETYLGNVNERPDLAQQVAEAKAQDNCWEVMIEPSDRPKGRILAHTVTGVAVGIVKGRDWLLQAGDVFATESGQLVLVSLSQQQVIALRFEKAVENRAIALIHLGHVLGNHHWPISIQDDVLYVEPVIEAAQMAEMIREAAQTLGIEGLQISFEDRADNSLEFSQAHPVH